MSISHEIQILHLEDRASDAGLVMRELKREGIVFSAKRVWTEAEFLAGLRTPALDLILADYELPHYDGQSALTLAHKERPEVPFIFVSGKLGEETAIEALQHGAVDFVLKHRLNRLGPAVRRAMREAQERKQIALMERQLTASERRYRELFGGIKSGVAVFEARAGGEEFVFRDVNAAVERIEGVTKERLLGKNASEVFPHIRSTGLLEVFQRVWKTGAPEHHPASVCWKDGVASWRENHVYKLPSGELVAVYDDVTENRQAGELLRLSEERLRLALDAGQMGAWEFDIVSGASWRTLRHDQIFGYTSPPAEWSYEIFLQHVVPEDVEMVKRAFVHALVTDQLSLECRVARPGQEPRWIAIQGCVSRNTQGERVRLMGTVSDISERKRAVESQARLVTAVEQAAEVIMITDAEGRMLYVNPAFERTTGYTRQEAIGQNPRILKSGKQDAAFYRQMWDTINRGEVWHGRLINKKKNGALFEEEATISPVRDASGRIVNFVAINLDVTHETALEAQLRQSQKMEAIGTLAGGVAHEINNPINGIMNYAQLIADDLPPDSAMQKYLANIMKETDRVAQIVRNLLSFARQDAQGRSPANLNDVINSTLTLIRTILRHDQITLQLDVQEGLPQMECRSQQLEQVLMNLLTNARDALNDKYPAYHENKIISITARRFEQDGKPWIRTTVEDHGTGIPVEARNRMFDPFYTTKPTGKGTGLGLSISYGLVNEHGGRLHFETELGRYTRFHMDLPIPPE